jgi:hypothetical protein
VKILGMKFLYGILTKCSSIEITTQISDKEERKRKGGRERERGLRYSLLFMATFLDITCSSSPFLAASSRSEMTSDSCSL